MPKGIASIEACLVENRLEVHLQVSFSVYKRERHEVHKLAVVAAAKSRVCRAIEITVFERYA